MRRRDQLHAPGKAGLARAASPAVLAAMLALAPQQAHAQAFLGTPTVPLGNVTRNVATGTEIISVDSAQAIINWVPNDNAVGGPPINFLPAGNSASFQSGVGIPYTVLNRIITADPSRAVALNGLVSSDAIGSIWFYAPGGLLIGSTAQFDVGALLLTANDPVGAAGGNPFLTGTSFQLAAASGSTAGVQIDAGAQIDVANYMIAVAPRLTMNGAVTLGFGGSAALVMAEDVSFTLNGGLFDISANIGSAAGGTNTINGSITGAGGIGGQGVYSRIYMMAVPRNDAMTLLISGGAQLGFDVANSADIDGNAIVLSGGHDIIGTPLGGGTLQFSEAPTSGPADVSVVVDNRNITSNLAIRSKNLGQVTAVAGSTQAAANVEIYASGQALASAQSGNIFSISGSLIVDASAGSSNTNGQSLFGGQAEVTAAGGGRISVGDDLVVNASAFGEAAFSPGLAGGNGNGGTARVLVTGVGSQVSATNYVLDAAGIGGFAAGGAAGNGFGGLAEMSIQDGGNALVFGGVSIGANAVAEAGADGQQSGDALAGIARLQLGSGVGLDVPNGNITITADGFYNEGGGAHLAGGLARGGIAELSLADDSSLATVGLFITARAQGSLNSGGNSFVGGQANVFVNEAGGGTSLLNIDDTLIDAGASASPGLASGNPNGGSATGGQARLVTTGSAILDLRNTVRVQAEAIGGNGGGGLGGAATGGLAHVNLINGGTLLVDGALELRAGVVGGNGTVGGGAIALDNGDGQPPAILLRLGPNSQPGDQGIQVTGAIALDATAVGGNGSSGAGGTARGGFSFMEAASGSINAASLLITASAVGGNGTLGGNARGGRQFQRINNADVTLTGDLVFEVDATGGNAIGGSGGAGGEAIVGQQVLFLSSLEGGPGASVTTAGTFLFARARGGAGGSGSTGGNGGAAFGSDPNLTETFLTIGVQPAQSNFTTGQLLVDNSSIGGAGGLGVGGNGGNGGQARSGAVNLGVISGPIVPIANQSVANFGNVVIDGRAIGGDGGTVEGGGLGGRGGDAQGNLHTILARGGIVNVANANIDASVTGGSAGFSVAGDLGGGNAQGGLANLLATPHFTAGLPAEMTVTGDVTILAGAGGGQSASAPGSAIGGTARVQLSLHEAAGAAAAATAGTLQINGNLLLDARGFGGFAAAAGVTGGNGTGGTAQLLVQLGTATLAGAATLVAEGGGGPTVDSALGLTGSGLGGAAAVTVDRGILTIAGDLSAAARGVLGAAVGGTVTLSTTGTGASLLVDSAAVVLDAQGLSGDGFEFGPGQDATGGSISISAGAGSLLRLRNAGQAGFIDINADGRVLNLNAFATAVGTGGSININAAGTLSIFGGGQGLALSASGQGGEGGSTLAGGAGVGGSIAITANPGGQILLDPEGQPFTMVANGTGGASGLAAGSGAGGSVRMVADGGSITVPGATDLQASGQAGDFGAGQAGIVQLEALAGGSIGLQSLSALAGGGLAPASGLRSGLVARIGGTIAIAGDGTLISSGSIGINDGGTITGGGVLSLNAAGQALSGFGTPTPGAIGSVTAPTIAISANGGVNLATRLFASTDVQVNSLAGGIQLFEADAGRDVLLTGTSIGFAALRGDRDVRLSASTAINGGPASAGAQLWLLSDGAVNAGALDAGTVDPDPLGTPSVYVRALGAITVGNVTSARDIGLVAQTSVTAGQISAARHAVLLSGGDIATGGISTGLTNTLYAGDFSQRTLISFAPGAPPDYTALLATAPLRVAGGISIGGDILTGALQLAATGPILFGGTVTASSLLLDSSAGITLGSSDVDGDIELISDGAVTLGQTSVGNDLKISAGAAITTLGISAGRHVVLTTPGTISTFGITAPGSVILSGVTGVNSGSISAGNGIVLLDTGGVSAPSLSTSPQGFVYIGSHELLPQISFDQAGNPIFDALLASTPIRLIGNINIAGTVSTGRFIAAATGNFFVDSTTAATSMLVDVGGTATLDFNVNTPLLAVNASDIVMDPLASVGVAGGSILFTVDSSATSAVIGGAGGTASPGVYRLSNAEFGALKASSITVRNANGGMTIEQLALPAIAPGDAQNPGITLDAFGLTRVTGAVTMAQAGSTNILRLLSGTRIEVVQGSGSIRLGSNTEAPAGTLRLVAPSIRVATAGLLDQIASGALTGQARDTALNATPAGGDAVGTLSAGTLNLAASQDLLIQNSGTSQAKAGFTAGDGGLVVTALAGGSQQPSLDLVINGRIRKSDGSFAVNLSTVDLVQFLPGLSGFTATSQVNGCVIGQTCTVIPEGLEQSFLSFLTSVEPLTPEEQKERERLGSPAEKLPVVMQQRLFDFGPLFSDVDATDPVTSGGNPALWQENRTPPGRPVGGQE